MRINKGVEWAAHACSVLVPLWPERGLPLSALAELHGVPEPYMAKQMQLLSTAGIVEGGRGRTGFYRLAKPPAQITLLDILVAIDGDEPMFRCTEIRQQGPCAARPEDYKLPCGIAAGFWRAERAYRDSLAAVNLATLVKGIGKQKGSEAGEWIATRARERR